MSTLTLSTLLLLLGLASAKPQGFLDEVLSGDESGDENVRPPPPPGDDFLNEVLCPSDTVCRDLRHCKDRGVLALPPDSSDEQLRRSGFAPCGRENQKICCPLREALPSEKNAFQGEACAKIDGYSCVPRKLCAANSAILVDMVEGEDDDDPFLSVVESEFDLKSGVDGIEPAVSINPKKSKCLGDLEVCCKDESILDRPIQPDLKPFQPRCGRHNAGGVGVTVEGAASAQFGEWPHMCMLFSLTDTGPPTFECGASLIAPGIVLTAAHCILRNEGKDASYQVRCGEWDTKSFAEEFPHQDRSVMKVTLHPRYNPESHEHDLAMLHVAQEFEVTRHIDTICIPDEDRGSGGYSTEGCYATGWGKEDFSDESQYQTLLQHVNLPIVPNDQCQAAFRKTRLGTSFKLDPSFMCAGGEEGNDTCRGDGGGPLMCPMALDPAVFVQVGVTAWGIGCGKDGLPGAYASLLHDVCFIKWTTQCYYGERYNELYDIGNCENFIQDETEKVNALRRKYNGYLRRNLSDKVKEKVNRYIGYTDTFMDRLQSLSSGCELLIGPRIDHPDFGQERRG